MPSSAMMSFVAVEADALWFLDDGPYALGAVGVWILDVDT